MVRTMESLMRALLVVLAILAPSLAHALDVPPRKAGLWEMTMTFEGRNLPQQHIKQCIDAATDKMMNSLGGQMGKEACAQQNVQQTAGSIVVDSTCKIGGGTIVSHAVVTGDFNSAYTVTVDSKHEGAMAPGMPASGDTKMVVAAKWLGPCAADQKPGDMILGGGIKMNIKNLPTLNGMPMR